MVCWGDEKWIDIAIAKGSDIDGIDCGGSVLTSYISNNEENAFNHETQILKTIFLKYTVNPFIQQIKEEKTARELTKRGWFKKMLEEYEQDYHLLKGLKNLYFFHLSLENRKRSLNDGKVGEKI